jgi:2-polyprenyl-3-methyl-5-hydroxy-6-metoxy-1,4-benzoquinol methylase
MCVVASIGARAAPQPRLPGDSIMNACAFTIKSGQRCSEIKHRYNGRVVEGRGGSGPARKRRPNMTAVKEHGYYSGLNMALAGLIKGKGLTVLDIGCGDGMLVEWLRKNGQIARAYGIEARPEAAARARSRCDVVWNADV